MYGFEIVYVAADGLVDSGSSLDDFDSLSDVVAHVEYIYAGREILQLTITIDPDRVITTSAEVVRIAEAAGKTADPYHLLAA